MLNRIFILLLLLVASCSAHASDDVGFRQTTLAGDEPQRPLQIAIWYPTDTGQQATVVGETPAFYGQRVILNGAIKAGIRPLVVLSHGYGEAGEISPGLQRRLSPKAMSWLPPTILARRHLTADPRRPQNSGNGQKTSVVLPVRCCRMRVWAARLTRTESLVLATHLAAGRLSNSPADSSTPLSS